MSGDGADGLDEHGKVIYSTPDEDHANYAADWGDAILGELRGIREAIVTLAVLYGAHNRITAPGEHDLMRPSSGQGYTAMGIAMSEAVAFLNEMEEREEEELAKGGADGS